ncbi:MAG: DHHW family protein [Candidatus Ornithomonoglobus sp.]
MSDRRTETGNIKDRYSYDEPPRKNARERFAEYQKELKEEKENRNRPPGKTVIVKKKEENKADIKTPAEEYGRYGGVDYIKDLFLDIADEIQYRLRLDKIKGEKKEKAAVIGLAAAIVLAIVIFIIILCSGKTERISFTGGSAAYSIGKEQFTLSEEPYSCDGAVYVPAEDILKQFGYEVVWNEEMNAFSVTEKKTVSYVYPQSDIVTYDGQDYQFKYPTMLHNDIVFMPVTMLTQFTEDTISTDGDFKLVKRPSRDTLETTSITDEYRLSAEPVKYNDVYLVGEDTAMEMLAYTDANSAEYASVVNSIAAELPEVKVYNIAIPSMAEFYGPSQIYTDQISGIKSIYRQLDPAVMPINAVDELWQHADEKIYFNTDHHWTQRGAYYAYKAFVENKGWEADPLESFETQNYDGFLGSWINELSGTPGADILSAHPELLERFMPKTEYSGCVYDDMRMQKLAADNWTAIKLDDNAYTTFLGGDMPLIHFRTNLGNGRSIMVIKESFGNAFAPWLLNNYQDIYIVDPRNFNGFGGHNEEFKLRTFYDEVARFDDLIIISYPNSTTSSLRKNILNLVK